MIWAGYRGGEGVRRDAEHADRRPRRRLGGVSRRPLWGPLQGRQPFSTPISPPLSRPTGCSASTIGLRRRSPRTGSTGHLGIPEELLGTTSPRVRSLGCRFITFCSAASQGHGHGPDRPTRHPRRTTQVPYLTFRYTVVRVWEESFNTLLTAGPGVAPLRSSQTRRRAGLPAAFERLQQQLRADRIPDNVERSLLGSTFILCGLRYRPEQIEDLYRNLSMTLERFNHL